MDSVTHVVLGAALGEVILGKKIGKQAMLWGAAAGSLPDLDIVVAPFQDEVTFLLHHRGITHSLPFVVIVGSILGWLVGRWYARSSTSSRNWVLLFLVCLLSHVLLDACTTYGTPLFLPFSDYRVAFNNIFIVDPFFTLPLLLGTGYCVLRPNLRRRQLVSYAAIVLSGLYLGMTFVNKYVAQQAFVESLAEQGIEPKRFMTGPTPLNSILWYCLAEDKDGYHVGYYSVLARQPVEFTFVPRNDDLLAGMREDPVIERLIWFSDGYYTVRRNNGGLVFDVLKFGVLFLDADASQTAFSFALERDAKGQVGVKTISRRRDIDIRKMASQLWERIVGRSSRS